MSSSASGLLDEFLVPQGDAARQAVSSLRGYAYQVVAAALAWVDLPADGRIYLEVAEDYAVVAQSALNSFQVKDTAASGTITINNEDVRQAILSFVELVEINDHDVHLHYFTTSEIGKEKAKADRVSDEAVLHYWRRAAAGADVTPLRSILEHESFPEKVRTFVSGREDEELREQLLRKIHWDCGKPNIADLQEELRQRLVVVLRSVFRLPTSDATRLVEVLTFRVLEKSIVQDTANRFLTRADFYAAVDESTRVSLPRTVVEQLTALSGQLVQGFVPAGLNIAHTSAEPEWIVAGSALPIFDGQVSRDAVTASLTATVTNFGHGLLHGPTGVGKSTVAGAVARTAGDYVLVDLRDADEGEAMSRLAVLLSRVGGLAVPTVIFEDLNVWTPKVTRSLGRVILALQRRDIRSITTSYTLPGQRSLAGANINNAAQVECPYFSEEETNSLVLLHGGALRPWGKLAHLAGGGGHPQLVLAFILGMKARGWPADEVQTIVSRGVSSADVDAEREGARKNLIANLPSHARSLLYRLSLIIGRFTRQTALAVAAAPPPIAPAGEGLDLLAGSWLEAVGQGEYRVSPLAGKSGTEMLSADEQTAIHCTIASQMVANGQLHAQQAGTILLHALAGKNNLVLFGLSRSIVLADDVTLASLAENMLAFRYLPANRSLYADEPLIAVLLRMAQLKILLTSEDSTEQLDEHVTALMKEVERIRPTELRQPIRFMALLTVLVTIGVANRVDGWLELLARFETQQARAGEAESEFLSAIDMSAMPEPVSALFAIGTAKINSVARLEKLVAQLSALGSKQRSGFLRALTDETPDFSVFVNSPWLQEHHSSNFDAADAQQRYRRMAAIAGGWPERNLVLQLWIAQAIMSDEYLLEPETALAILDEASELYGDDVLLQRARAKIFWRSGDHPRALEIMAKIANEVGAGNAVERAFALREAAISAAKTGDWQKASAWFLEASAAASSSHLPEMDVMAAGLLADAAAASLEDKDLETSISLLERALDLIAPIDPHTSLVAEHCHRLIRHTVLWVQTNIDGTSPLIGGSPISMVPGSCSNPEPDERIKDHPLGPINLAWYMLAQAEVTAGIDTDLDNRLQTKLGTESIPFMEGELRTRRIARAIATQDAQSFARWLWPYVEASAHVLATKDDLKKADTRNLPTGSIPALRMSSAPDAAITRLLEDAILSFVVSAVCTGSPEAIHSLKNLVPPEIETATGGLIARSAGLQPHNSELDATFVSQVVGDAVAMATDQPSPQQCAVAAVRFLQHVQTTMFKRALAPIVTEWHRRTWLNIIESQQFLLPRPRLSVPELRRAIDSNTGDGAKLAHMVLASADAVDLKIPMNIRDAISRA